jgi:hypothetical protein
MLLAGCAVDRVPPSDAAMPRFVEVRFKSPLPRVATLRAGAATGATTRVVALRAPAECVSSPTGPLVRSESMDRHLAWLDHAAHALDARLVVVPTPVDVTPGARSRDLLRAYAERLPRPEGRTWVWSPRGAWEPESAYALAESLGLVCAFEPLHAPRPPGPIGYARLSGLGVESRLSTTALQRVFDAMDSARGTAYVVAEGPHALRHASLLQQLADMVA